MTIVSSEHDLCQNWSVHGQVKLGALSKPDGEFTRPWRRASPS